MTSPLKENIQIIQGAQFSKSFHWYGGGKIHDLIDGVTVGYPTVITVTGHSMPTNSPTPIHIGGVKGARNLNTLKDGKGKDCDMVLASYIDANSFSVPIATENQVYSSGGHIEWYSPKVLTSWTARMQIRDALADAATLVSLTSGAGDIVISTEDARITFIISTSATEALDFVEGVYDLELVDPAGEATRLLEGKVTLRKEVTR